MPPSGKKGGDGKRARENDAALTPAWTRDASVPRSGDRRWCPGAPGRNGRTAELPARCCRSGNA